jgi:RNA polymerase sigma factor (sigma-70 family)
MHALVASLPVERADPTLLVERCLAGDRRAQQEIYQRYAKAMFNVCMRIVNNYAEAQDVMQDSFVNAFRHLGTFKAESTFGAWLKRIVVNGAIAHMKKKRLDLVPLTPTVARTLGEDDPGHHGFTDDEDRYQVESVRRAVQQLPDGYRTVLTLYIFEGYDHGEIADIMGITESTSKSQFNRAKAKLKDILADTLTH